jgi:hypothetical protein
MTLSVGSTLVAIWAITVPPTQCPALPMYDELPSVKM